MNNKIFYIIFAFALFFSSSVKAQNEKYGSDPEACRIHLSTYTEFFKQNNFKDALPSWRWCFNNCPEASKNIYIHGTTIIEYFIGIQTDEKAKQAYIDTLMLVYDNRIKCFDQKALVLGRKATSMLKYRSHELKKAFDVYAEAVKLGGEETEYYVFGFYMNTAVLLNAKGEVSKEKVVELYTSITDLLNKQLAKETNEEKKQKIAETAKAVEDNFTNSGVADCATIIELYTPKFKENPKDIELAKKIIFLLDKGSGDDCKLSDLYMQAAVVVYNSEKSSSSAHSIAQSYFRRNDFDKAEEFYGEAIKLEETASKKADMYYELALLYYSSNNYPRARTAVRNAVGADPTYGKAYMLLGRIYSAGGRNCGETAFERKSLNWLIVDQFNKAKNADSSLTTEANELISRFSANFPTKEDAFWISIEEGQTVTIGCWIQESTVTRFIK